MNQVLAALSRLFISVIFIVAGIEKISQWRAMSAYMANKGVPLVPVLLALSLVVEIICGLGLLLGLRARTAAIILFIYLIPVTLTFHNFWALQGLDRSLQMVNFLKNLAIMGGLLGVAAWPQPETVIRIEHEEKPERAPGEETRKAG